MRIEGETKPRVVVENITGGGTVPAAQSVINSPPDGIKLFFTGSSSMTVMQHTNPKLSINPEKELTPITFVNTLPHWIVVKPDRPEKNLQDLIEYIKNNPGKASISINAVGSSTHLMLANWALTNKLDFTIVPYRGSPPAMTDLLAGATTAHIDVIGSSIAHVKEGRAKALSVLQTTPSEAMPSVPVSPDENKGGLILDGRHLLAVKAGTPPAVVNDIYKVIEKVTAEPGFIELLNRLGFERSVPTPEKTREIITEESNRYKEIVRVTQIKLN
jgi:tripartite-type tricarboxylate transporter receptor subunit TctC